MLALLLLLFERATATAIHTNPLHLAQLFRLEEQVLDNPI